MSQNACEVAASADVGWFIRAGSARAGASRRWTRVVLAVVTLAACGGVGGCFGGSASKAPLATDVDPEEATAEYWWDKPAPVRVPVGDFDRAVAASERALRDLFFEVERSDARAGVVTSKAMTAGQWFEPWRRDNSTLGDDGRNLMATYRRTVRFDVTKTPDGRWVVSPRVLVERQTVIGRRVTGVLGFTSFTAIDQSSIRAKTEEGEAPATYWYATGRDSELEVRLGEAVVANMYGRWTDFGLGGGYEAPSTRPADVGVAPGGTSPQHDVRNKQEELLRQQGRE